MTSATQPTILDIVRRHFQIPAQPASLVAFVRGQAQGKAPHGDALSVKDETEAGAHQRQADDKASSFVQSGGSARGGAAGEGGVRLSGVKTPCYHFQGGSVAAALRAAAVKVAHAEKAGELDSPDKWKAKLKREMVDYHITPDAFAPFFCKNSEQTDHPARDWVVLLEDEITGSYTDDPCKYHALLRLYFMMKPEVGVLVREGPLEQAMWERQEQALRNVTGNEAMAALDECTDDPWPRVAAALRGWPTPAYNVIPASDANGNPATE